MGRKIKDGLDYFPFDVGTPNDRDIRKLVRKHGPEGIGIYVYILFRVYKEKGYYLEFDEEIYQDLTDDFLQSISIEQVKIIIESCLSIGLFDSEMFNNFHILTSKGIQERYQEVKKYLKGAIKDEYLIRPHSHKKSEKTSPKQGKDEKPAHYVKPEDVIPITPKADIKKILSNFLANRALVRMYANDYKITERKVMDTATKFAARADVEEIITDANHFKNALKKQLEKCRPTQSDDSVKHL